jgi:hypothetical protein
VPAWVLAWGASLVLLAWFVALAILRRAQRASRSRERQLVRLPKPALAAGQLTAAASLTAIAVLGFSGAGDDALAWSVFVGVWIVGPVISVTLGNVLVLLAPWNVAATTVERIARQRGRARPLLTYPAVFGRWPATAGIIAFGGLGVVVEGHVGPRAVAICIVVYAVVQFVAALTFGASVWAERGDPICACLGLFARLAPLRWTENRLLVRPPCSALGDVSPEPGTAALVVAPLGVGLFAGLAHTGAWRSVTDWVASEGTSDGVAEAFGRTIGLVASCAFAGAILGLFVWGVSTVIAPRARDRLVRRLVTAFLPLALAYPIAMLVVAHPPVGTVLLRQLAATTVLVAASAVALKLVFDSALAAISDSRVAIRCLYWMYLSVVTLSCLGVWVITATR